MKVLVYVFEILWKIYPNHAKVLQLKPSGAMLHGYTKENSLPTRLCSVVLRCPGIVAEISGDV